MASRPHSAHSTAAWWRRQAVGYAFVAPALIVFLGFIIYPVVYSLWLSFHEWNGFTADWGPFVGFGNYLSLGRDPIFWKAVKNTLIFVLARTPFEVGIAYGLALLLNRAIPGRGLLRTLFFVPVVMSLIVVTLLFQRIYETNTGLLNTFLENVKLGRLAHPWLADPATALWAVIGVSVWKNVGFSLVILLAGLQGVPEDVIEAARVDGANAWQVVLRIITPLMMPMIALTTLLSIISGLKVFDLVFIMTRGGPVYSTEVLATLLYRQAFELNNMGVASAVSVVLVAIVMGTAVMQFAVIRNKE